MSILGHILRLYGDDGFSKLDSLDDEKVGIKFGTGTAFDNAIVGVEYETGRLIYSYQALVEIIMSYGLSETKAAEYFDTKVKGSHKGNKLPIFIILI
jgi:hypothetical protein